MSDEISQAAEVTGAPDPEWLALLDRARAGGDDAGDAVCDAYSRGIQVGLRRAVDAVLPAAVTAEGELDAVVSGLEPDQEIRARAAEIVYPGGPPFPVTDAWEAVTRAAVYEEVDNMAAYIRDGSKPA